MPDAPEGEKSPGKSRRDLLEDEGVEPEMPALDWGEYLVRWLFEFGPAMVGGMGSSPVPPSEIEAWQRQLGIALSPWEFKQLLALSKEYVGEFAAASKLGREPPFSESSDARRILAAKLERDLDRFLD